MDTLGARGTLTACYGLTGVLNALWGATLPATDARLDLDAARLGGLLMALAVGALAAMPVAGRLADRRGGRWLLRLAAPAAALALAGPALAPTVETLTVAAVVLGVLFGALNVALSVQAVAVERAAGRPVMATMHGTWTLGAVLGGAVVAAGLRAGLDARGLMVAGALVLAAAGLAAGGAPATAAPVPVPGSGPLAPTVPVRTGLLVALGVIGAAAFLTEGAATDWAGVHATRVLGADQATASLVYTLFFVAMTAVRFAGDAARARLGVATTIRLAGCTATAGYGLVLVAGALPGSGSIGCAATGWALAGAGIAVVWPVVTSALGTAGATAGRLSTVTTISYGGGLVGPALIGAVAAQATLPVAMLIPAALALLVATVAPAVLAATLRGTEPLRTPMHELARR